MCATALAAAHDPPGAGVSTQPPQAAKKRSRASRTSATDRMATPAEQLWSGKTRGFFEFEPIAPTNGLELGAVGVAVGAKGRAAFFSYLKRRTVVPLRPLTCASQICLRQIALTLWSHSISRYFVCVDQVIAKTTIVLSKITVQLL